MDAARWQRLDDVYHRAAALRADQRGAFLTQACNGDDDLRRRVERLLAQDGSTGALVDRSAWQGVANLDDHRAILSAGEKLGPYEVTSLIGSGGMGQVYRGVDTRLDRPVAIKLCHASFSEWFEGEARAISALNHSNICTLYDVGPNYLVMELVEGETLAQRIERIGPLPPKEALDIALQITEALGEAHRKAIVHRDLKPANVKITPAGRVKVLDFGLAKDIRSDRNDDASLVEEQVLGTPAYMSPEQARGELVDSRTDIWAFGCVLYAMLSGRRPFIGETSGETMHAIVEDEPDWSALPSSTPSSVRELVRKCLQKDIGLRLQDIHLAGTEIEDAANPIKRSQLFSTPTVFGFVVVVAIGVWLLRGRNQPSEQIIHPVPLTTYLGTQDWPSFSPDGNQVAFSWDGDSQDNFDIYVKKIGSGAPFRLTQDPAPDRAPAWSPDGSAIAFLRTLDRARAAIVSIPPAGGAERLLARVAASGPNQQFLTWSADSKWLATFDRPEVGAPGLWLISANTGERRRLTTVSSGALADFSPAFAPDGRTLAFARMVANNSSDIYLLPLGQDLSPGNEPQFLSHENQVMGLAWAPNGRELIISSGPPGNLALFRIAISDGQRKRLTEQGEILNLAVSSLAKRLVFSQSRREMDIYRVELSANGEESHRDVPVAASSRLERYPRYSPDGGKIAFVSLRSGNWQLWICDALGKNPSQMTSFQRAEVAYPTWSADGQRIGFTANPDGVYRAYVIDAAGGEPRVIQDLGTNIYAWNWSRNGRWIFFASARGGTQQLWKMPSSGGVAEQMTQQGASGGATAESADGKLLYYTRQGGIWSVPLNGGPECEVLRFEVDQGWLEATPSGIYFVANSTVTKPGDLMFCRFPNGPPAKVAGVRTRYGFSLSPDRHYLVYTKMTATGSDLMMVEGFR